MTDARTWMRQGTKLFLDATAELSDDAFDEPSGLPGWTRRHVVAHLHYNAEALRRLVSWAATGMEKPMYASAQARAEEIEQGALLPVGALRELVATSAAALEADLDALPDAGWAAEVRTAQGRLLPASQIPWLRAREVAVHAVDLRAGVTFADLPEGFVAELLVDVVRRRAANGDGPDLAAWLTGRTESAPTLGPWL
jgi:maleylpyruvate isomerase